MQIADLNSSHSVKIAYGCLEICIETTENKSMTILCVGCMLIFDFNINI